MLSKILETFFKYIPFVSPRSLPEQATIITSIGSDDKYDDPPQMPHFPPSSPQTCSQPATSFDLDQLPRPMLMDLFDLRCHEVILETDQQTIAVRVSRLNGVRGELTDTTPQDLCTRARFILAEHTEHLMNEDFGHVREGPLGAFKVCVIDCQQHIEKWNLIRQAVILARPNHKHDDLLQGDFRAVERLLHCHHILAVFRYELHDNNPTSVQEAIENLENGWNGGSFLLEQDEEVQVLAPEEVQSLATEQRTMMPSCIQNILKPLRKRRPNIDECLQRCRNLLWGDESTEFSQAHLQRKMHALIIRWSESILGPPKLFSLCAESNSQASNSGVGMNEYENETHIHHFRSLYRSTDLRRVDENIQAHRERKRDSSNISNEKKPTPFTREQEAAILFGATLFKEGHGHRWELIRLSDECLWALTGTQIKDKYRTMMQQAKRRQSIL